MKFETAQKSAARLGVTVRAVQKWAKEGKIPYAHKEGRDWFIPQDAVAPTSATEFIPKNEPFPILNNYETGKITDYIRSIANQDDRNIALCEYYYFIGEFEKCIETAKPYLTSKNPLVVPETAVFVMFSNLCLGNLKEAANASRLLGKNLDLTQKGDTQEVKAVKMLCGLIAKNQLQLKTETNISIKDYVKHLDEGVGLFACYIMALESYLNKDYSRALGIAETALSFADDNCVIPRIYLLIVKAVCYINLQNSERAVKNIEEAWNLASPDGIILPFVENYNLLLGVVEKHLKKNHPKDYAKIISISKKFSATWFEGHNKSNKGNMATNLTAVEYTIAMLYSRNWKAKEIAAHMELSERTIMNYITLIYDKLQINGKKDLEKHLIK